jgi:hypothetical protein
MGCVYPSFVRRMRVSFFCASWNFCGSLRLKEHLAFVGDKNAGDPVPTAQEVLSGSLIGSLYTQMVGARNEKPMNLNGT